MTAPASLHTPLRIIPQALRDAGRLQMGSTPSGEVFADCMSRLSDIINTWQTQGVKLWLNSIQSLTLTAGVATYTLGPAGAITSIKPSRVIAGWYVFPSKVRYPLNALAWESYYGLGNTTNVGAVNSYFADKQAGNIVIKLWQVPDATAALGTVELQVQRQATAPIELDETLSFPTEWAMALRWALADDLATGQPALIMDRCERKATMYRTMLEDWDVEDTPTRFAASYQFTNPSSFR